MLITRCEIIQFGCAGLIFASSLGPVLSRALVKSRLDTFHGAHDMMYITKVVFNQIKQTVAKMEY